LDKLRKKGDERKGKEEINELGISEIGD